MAALALSSLLAPPGAAAAPPIPVAFESTASDSIAPAPAPPVALSDSATFRRAPPPAAPAGPIPAGLLRPDRLEHASLSFTLGLGAGLAARRPAVALAVALPLGLGKEVWDRKRSGFDALDLAADVLGAGLATLASAALTR